jgi:hypothetical protein
LPKVSRTEVAIQGLQEVYKNLNEPQLAAFHRVPRERIVAWKAGELVSPEVGGVFQNVLHIGGLASGKSFEQRFQELALSAFIPNNRGVIVRKRWEELLNHIYDSMKGFVIEYIGAEFVPALMSEPKRIGSSFEIKVYTTGTPSSIFLKNEPDGPDRHIEDHFKGDEYGWVSLEEATDLREITWRTLKGRVRRKFPEQFPESLWEKEKIPGENYQDYLSRRSSALWAALAVTNPPYEGHWIDKKSKESEKEMALGELTRFGDLIVRSGIEDNLDIMGQEYYEALQEEFKNDPVGYAMMIEGKNGILIEGTPVYGKHFRSDLHCSEDLGYNPFKPLYVGLDFGYLRPAAVFAQEDVRGCYNTIGELCPENKEAEELGELTLDYIAQEFPALQAPIYYFGDHAGSQKSDKGDTTIDRLANLGIIVMSQPLQIDSSLDTIRRLLSTMIGGDKIRPRLMIHSGRCPVLTQAVSGGYYYKMRNGMLEPKPYKTPDNHMDDVCDAWRYLFANLVGSYGENLIESSINFDQPIIAAKGISGEEPDWAREKRAKTNPFEEGGNPWQRN